MPLSLPRSAFEKIVAYLIEVEEERTDVLDACFPKPSTERERLRQLLDDYVRSVGELIGKIKVSGHPVDMPDSPDKAPERVRLPFVLVGSEVAVVDLDGGEEQSFRIDHPFKTDESGYDISYLSPLGSSLLLKKAGQKVAVKVPAGKIHYQIKSIWLS